MGRFLCCGAGFVDRRGFYFHFYQPEDTDMNSTVKSYLYFLAFLAVTKMVVKPVATQMNLPLLKDIV